MGNTLLWLHEYELGYISDGVQRYCHLLSENLCLMANIGK